jgi:MFS family permease
MFYTHGTFVVAIVRETDWSRGQVQFGFTIMSLMAIITAPTIGWLVDRFGARIVALTSLFGFLLGCAVLAMTGTSIFSYYVGWVLLAILAAGTLPITWTSVINEWFVENRGLALGLTLSGTGIAASLAPAYASGLITDYGWRSAYLLLALSVLAIGLPVVYLFFRSPESTEQISSNPLNHGAESESGLSLSEALSGYHFWIIAFSIFCVAGSIAGLITNIVPLLTDRNFSVAEASGFTGLIGVSVITGRLLIGYLIDRFWAPLIAAIFLSTPGIGALLLIGSSLEPLWISVSVILIGLAAGAEVDLFAYLTSRYFGLKRYGSIYGVVFMVFSVSAGLAPAVFGFSFDLYGSYDLIFPIAAVLSIIGGLAMLLLGAYPDFETKSVNQLPSS